MSNSLRKGDKKIKILNVSYFLISLPKKECYLLSLTLFFFFPPFPGCYTFIICGKVIPPLNFSNFLLLINWRCIKRTKEITEVYDRSY